MKIRHLTKSQLKLVLTNDKMLPCDSISVGYNVKYQSYSFYFLKDDRIKHILFMTRSEVDCAKVRSELYKYFGDVNDEQKNYSL